MSNDLWRTPKEVFNTLDREFNFVADMAAGYENRLCGVFFSEDDDSLSFNWKEKVDDVLGGKSFRARYAWLNCPYSNPMPWIKKAAEAQSNGLGVVMLLNADNSVGWFAEALKTASEIRYIIADETKDKKREYSSGRLAFINEIGEAVSGNNKPQMILVFNPFKIGSRITSYIKKSELLK